MSFLTQLPEQIRSKWTFKEPLPIQNQMIPAMLEGQDIVAQSPTGTGKTLAFTLPLLTQVDGSKKQVQALIIAPSQELAIQTTDVIREWVVGTSITVAPLIGGANVKRQIERLKKKPTIVVGTPGRLNELVQAKKLKMFEIHHVILDEADVLLSRDHRVVVKNLIKGAHPTRQVVAVSATITPEIERVAQEFMKEPVRFTVSPDQLPRKGEVTHSYIEVEMRDKTDVLRGLAHIEGLKALAFINNIDQVRMKEMKLQYNKAPIAVLHSNMRSQERQQALESFRKGRASILITTDLAARGLDIRGLTHVIHADVPHTLEQYIHRSGRTGRAGKDGEVLTLLTKKEERDYRRLTRTVETVEKVWEHGALREK